MAVRHKIPDFFALGAGWFAPRRTKRLRGNLKIDLWIADEIQIPFGVVIRATFGRASPYRMALKSMDSALIPDPLLVTQRD